MIVIRQLCLSFSVGIWINKFITFDFLAKRTALVCFGGSMLPCLGSALSNNLDLLINDRLVIDRMTISQLQVDLVPPQIASAGPGQTSQLWQNLMRNNFDRDGYKLVGRQVSASLETSSPGLSYKMVNPTNSVKRRKVAPLPPAGEYRNLPFQSHPC